MKGFFSTAAALILLAGAGFAQDDNEKLKKRILEEVEKRLRAEEERILKEVEKIIDEELSKGARSEKKTSVEKPTGRPFLGISPIELSNEERAELKVECGVRIVGILDGGPAAGLLRKDDILLTIDDAKIEDLESLQKVLTAKKSGQTVKMEVLRGGKREIVKLTLGTKPEERQPERVEPRKDEPQGKDELRERVKKFLDRQEKDEKHVEKKVEKKEEKKSEEPSDEFLALDDEMFNQIRPLLEQFGMNPEEYFEKGKDGKWRPNEGLRDMFKQFDFKRFFGGGEEPPVEKKEEKKVEKRVEEKKVEKKTESSKPAWLGIVPGELGDEDRAQLDLEEGVGIVVVETRPGSPAEKAGLQKNDILVRIDGKKIRGEEGLQKFIQTAKAGQTCEIVVIRKGAEVKVKTILGERKD